MALREAKIVYCILIFLLFKETVTCKTIKPIKYYLSNHASDKAISAHSAVSESGPLPLACSGTEITP